MSTQIVIIHGWSADKDDFRNLAAKLQQRLSRSVENMWLGDYISLDDQVKVDDIVDALDAAWQAVGLPRKPNSVDVIVHSTAGLIIRHWMHKYYTSRNKKPPVRNLVMLAPANFGSPLAHTGRSMIGRILKGDKTSVKPFQSGSLVLKSLEMASPYSWQLAELDRFAPNAFSRGGVRCTVIVGNCGYKGLRSLANKPGSDGTVYVCTSSLNCARVNIDVARGTGAVTAGELEHAKGGTAFLILDGFNHGTVTGRKKTPRKLVAPLIRALDIGEDENVSWQEEFESWQQECELETRRITEKYARTKDNERHSFQNMVFLLKDDQGHPIRDYVIEFYGNFTEEEDEMATMFHKEVSAKIHAYKDDEAYRSFLLDVSELYRNIDRVDETLKISLSAFPDIHEENTVVGYRTFEDDEIGELEINAVQLREYFQPHRTLFVTITLPRYQDREVFTLENVGPGA